MALEHTINKFLRDNPITDTTTESDLAILTMLAQASNIITTLRMNLGSYLKRMDKLQALEEAGVDNWEGYGDAMAELHTEDEDEED